MEMGKSSIKKDGCILRALKCPKCEDKIAHPEDLRKLEDYQGLKRKTFSVKLRMVGNSHTISIPKEIVDFINGTNRRMSGHMNDMVKLCFEDFERIILRFPGEESMEKRKW